ncbi:hypothetical protein J7S33_04305, partial [Saccharothrix algeriensis]
MSAPAALPGGSGAVGAGRRVVGWGVTAVARALVVLPPRWFFGGARAGRPGPGPGRRATPRRRPRGARSPRSASGARGRG